LIAVPMLKDGKTVVGAITIYRQEVRPFTDKQVELVQNFAAQAVIAIENARLLNELRQRTTDLTERTADLTEALEQQTATSQVLQVISNSTGDLEHVFGTMLGNATRICEATFGALYLSESDGFRATAMHNAPPAYEEARAGVVHPPPSSSLWRAANTRQAFQIADVMLERGYIERDPFVVSAVALGGYRSVLSVPMLHEDKLVGVITIFRQEVRPFSDKQIELVQNFAAQAVIAIENARLLNELRQRTTELTEALEQQTATSDVLRVISSSPGDLEPVFQAVLQNATRICDAKYGMVFRFDGNAFSLAAEVDTPPAFAEYAKKRGPFRPVSDSHLERVMRTKQLSHTDDYAAESITVPPVTLGGARSTVDVPMLLDNELIGAFSIYRQEVRPFTDKQIALLTTFAAQAVIAIENPRLLKELRERTEQVEAQSQELVGLNQQLERRVVDQVGEIERMGRLRRFLPPQVADLIVASGTEKQLESHRREITALFCDLRGFTGFSESSDPEDVMALLRDYHGAIGEIIIKYSGTLERYAGDGVMVVFNDPVPVDSPALQAVLMALEMREAIGALTERWRRLGHDIGFGIGIAHGFATLGTIGFEGRFDYAAIGTVSNVASRLCDEAKPGQILISPRVLMAVEDAVTVEPVGEFALKGIRRPLAAYNVLAQAG
jgi:GAF domain-containing protein